MGAAPAFAQDATAAAAQPMAGSADQASSAPAANAPAAQNGADDNAIVVTGSLIRRTSREAPSPVIVLNSDDLAKRGITTVSAAVQSLASANGGSLPASFSANGAFAGGASGVSLRGLTTDSTLVLFDGLRAAYYPLADDGARSFVDLNTIPDAIVDRIETQQDGASATYGADAIAGVVNIIIKKQITGFQGTVEGGISQRQDAGHQRIALTYGYGDLQSQGFNVYVSGEYQHDEQLMDSDRGYPYNSSNLSGINLGNGVTGPDLDAGAVGPGATTSAVVRPATETIPGDILSGAAVAGSTYQVLSPTGCGTGTTQHAGTGGSYCEQDLVNQYGVISPEDTRKGVTARATAKLGDHATIYAMGTYYQNTTYFTGDPSTVRSANPIYTANIVLPATLSNGALNPNDPYAASGQAALLYYRFGDIPTSTKYVNNTERFASGINGDFGNGWTYNVEGVYMHSKLDATYKGLLNINGLTSAINDGTYNFVDPSSNGQAVLDEISPTVKDTAKSTTWQVQGTLAKELVDLPGGKLTAALTGQVRYESIDDPNFDSDLETVGLNPFSAVGHRYNEAASYQIDAPVFDQLFLTTSGRYDHYSTGFSHFSPSFGIKVTPVRQIAFRATLSKGFRAPSIPETQGAVIGYTPYNVPADVYAAHGGDAYVQQYSLGLNSAGNPNLKPETSTNFTAGVVLQPTHWLSLTGDFYHIKKKDVIVAGQASASVADAYAETGVVPAGYTVTANPVDPDYPNLNPTAATINSLYVNANSLVTSGIDLQATATLPITDSIKFTSSISATEIFKYNIHTDDGTYHYVGTLGSYNITSASGTPRWKGNWQNTVTSGPYSLTATVYFTDGYRGTADDYSGASTAQVCDSDTAIALGSDGSTPVKCHVHSFTDVDLTASYAVNTHFTVYTNIFNVFDTKAPFDPNTYGGNNYNPAWAAAGIIGRYFKIGANFNF